MKHLLNLRLMMVGCLSFLLYSCAITSHTERAADVDFSAYKTFSWAGNHSKDSRIDNDIVDNNIKNTISAALEKKGWMEVSGGGDVLLDYTVAVQRSFKREKYPDHSIPYTSYFYAGRGIYSIWSPDMLMDVHTFNVPFREGQLTISMVDAKTNKLIWQGWATGEISSGSITSNEATTRIKSIFKKFDYPEQKVSDMGTKH